MDNSRKVFAALFVFSAVGFAILLIRSTPSVHAHDPNAEQIVYEYKVSVFPVNDPIKQAEILNRNGAKRWEYVGLIQPPYTQNGKHSPRSFVAFRRVAE
ncbi:secreted protein [Rhodopirellula sallentina]|uniref:Secreted protein n=1 Tax=Rhodopirellula sallentina SM41 TaxID=1263870 RepID=M5TU18_9BACT|nr:secreted protein [Rhodopirellula sallentina]EMI52554.1 secreted protein [Rhodopirellula sallentina SM41]